MDVVALARHGIDFSIATLGTATTGDHLNALFRITDTVSFCFDGDRAGKAAAWRALENALPHIREGRQLRFVFLPEGHDPDSYVNEFGADAFVGELDSGMALSDFLIGELAGQVDMTTVDGKARLAELARPLIRKIPRGVYRELLVGSLADAVGLSAARLEKMLGGPDSDAGGASLPGKPVSSRGGRPDPPQRRSRQCRLQPPESGETSAKCHWTFASDHPAGQNQPPY